MQESPVESLQQAMASIETTLDGGRLGLAFRSHCGIRGGYRQDDIFPTASSIKIAIVAALQLQFEAGDVDRRTLWDWSPEALVGGSGVLSHLCGPASLSLDDLAKLTLVVSDNTASNVCLAAAGGPDAINSWLTDCGAVATRVHRPIRFDLQPDDPPHTATGSPRDFVRMLESLPVAVWERMAGCSTSFLNRFLDVNPFAGELNAAAPAFCVVNKPGAVDGVRNDVGRISWAGGHVDIAVMTRDVPDGRWTAENKAERAVGLASRAVLQNLGVLRIGEDR